MSITATAAANAYAAASKIADPVQAKGAGAGASEGGGFADMVKDAVSAINESGAQTDKLAMASATGKADVVDVVTAVAETELAMQTLVTVRDRVISSYQEIMRMPI